MHIVLLNDHRPDVPSSVSTIVSSLANGYRAAGHTVSIIATHRKEHSKYIERFENVVSIPVSYRQSLRQYMCLYMPKVSTMIDKELTALKPDIVHAHNIHGYLTYHALKVAKKHTSQVYITMHDVMSFSYIRLATKRFLQSKGEDCTLTLFDNIRAAELQYNPLRNSIIRYLLKNCSKIICPSKALEKALHANGIFHTTVIHNGIELQEWSVTQKDIDSFKSTHNLHNKKVILFGGRLSVDKGAIPLLHIVDRLRTTIPNVLLFVAGDSKRWQGLVEAAHASEDLQKHIYNPGWMDRNEIKVANFVADIVTTPSLCLDVFPSTNLEAMAAGTPVVGTCFGGTPEVVVHTKTGLIVDPQNEEDLYTALQTLLTNKELGTQMGQNGILLIQEQYTIQKQAQKLLDLFTSSSLNSYDD